ncbi:methylamine utilization protein [Xanthomonas oryzae pv. oryzae]|nr:cytochrome c peroxidase [Xanthomonas oryzae]AJQ81320.1 methylamine utilization protein [Xanthomonas oryzae pv. oryzae PXO86]ALZ70232.1 methylamine utilization protein [Xanthomonas oryzae pv. oryzae]AOS00731.1 methylamine utilization protein [Xanthomonas oryzae pv. oryzae]AOS04903.1 methylamine utilization protein [Xanthomonas oryzae pv. oryzae]AOS09059.1 methylamine utilization protein [Xanthomonas oryzae pv. oryzae]
MSRQIIISIFLTVVLLLLGVRWLAGLDLDQGERRQATVALGNTLFQDTTLSARRTLACSSCHDPSKAFAQDIAVPIVYGQRTGTRNVPSLLDLPYFTHFFWDGREEKLERVAVAAFTNQAEMAQPDMSVLIKAVSQRLDYRTQFKAAFGDERVDQERISSAILAYLASVTTGRSRYDAFVAGNTTALTTAERRGLDVFRGKADCSSCHALNGTPAAFTDNRFHHSNVGMDRMAGQISTTIESFKTKREQGVPVAELVLSDPDMAALGRFAISGQGNDLAAYRTPTLRNVTRTPPYMHDGSVQNLEEAIQREIYYRSLSRGTPISLTAGEKNDLYAFLHALEDLPNNAH